MRRSDSGLKASCPSTTQRTESVILTNDFRNFLLYLSLLPVLRQKRGEIPNSPYKNLKNSIRTRSAGVINTASVIDCFLLHSPTPRKRQFYKRVVIYFLHPSLLLLPHFRAKIPEKIEKSLIIFRAVRRWIIYSLYSYAKKSTPYYLERNTTPCACEIKKRPGSAHESYREHSSWPSSSSVDDYVAIS